jgi:hypothetical protein
MTVVFPFFQGDVIALRELLLWIAQLGCSKNHEALLVADTATQWSDCLSLLEMALPAFHDVRLICTEQPVTGWPQGSNALFRCAAEEMAKRNQPFLWMEPDAIPLRIGWLDSISKAYEQCGKPFMGRTYRSTDPGVPSTMLSGIAVYPADTMNRIGALLNGRAFDVSIADGVVPQSAHTKLIQWFWGQPKLAPTFAKKKETNSPINTFTLETLESEAVIFHRNKDGTLLSLLRNRMFPCHHEVPLTIVMSFFRNDAVLAAKTLDWVRRLGTPPTYDILLNYEVGTPAPLVSSVVKTASQAFAHVYQTHYRRPTRGMNAPTVAFIHAAMTMQVSERPFLWMEPDTIPIKSNWLSVLQSEYDRCGKPFCGPIVPFRGHMNGTGIYPANTPERIPATMRSPGEVWDWKMRHEMIADCHDCSKVFFHTWGEIGGKLHPTDGPAPNFRNPGLFEQIPETAVIMHRCKDGSLIDELTKRL